MAQPVHHKSEYSALIGLFTQACRTPAKFARSNISGDRKREGFTFVCFLCKKVSENNMNGIYRRRICSVFNFDSCEVVLSRDMSEERNLVPRVPRLTA